METLKKYLNRYFIDAMGAMALGLFASLLIGTIFGTIYKYTELELLNTIATFAKGATGAAIGVAIAHRLGAHLGDVLLRGCGRHVQRHGRHRQP